MKISRSMLATAAVASVLALTACGETGGSSEEPSFRDAVPRTSRRRPPTRATYWVKPTC